MRVKERRCSGRNFFWKMHDVHRAPPTRRTWSKRELPGTLSQLQLPATSNQAIKQPSSPTSRLTSASEQLISRVDQSPRVYLYRRRGAPSSYSLALHHTTHSRQTDDIGHPDSQQCHIAWVSIGVFLAPPIRVNILSSLCNFEAHTTCRTSQARPCRLQEQGMQGRRRQD